MGRRKARKNIKQQEKGALRQSSTYLDAGTRLTEEQARRVAQLRQRDAGELMPTAEVRAILTHTGQALRM